MSSSLLTLSAQTYSFQFPARAVTKDIPLWMVVGAPAGLPGEAVRVQSRTSADEGYVKSVQALVLGTWIYPSNTLLQPGPVAAWC